MATVRRTGSSNPPSTSSPSLVVQQLTDLFRANGHRVVHGDKVCLTSESLTLLNNYFQLVDLDITPPTMNERSRSDSIPPLPQLPPVQHMRIDTRLRENLVFLHDFLRNKIKAVKLIQNTSTLQGNVLLHPFHNIVCLELKKIQPNMVRGLAILREQLETLICSYSVLKIETLISDCGADLAQGRDWPRLKSLFLDHNFIERIDESLRFLPVLEVLDLSHNRLKDCSKIFENIPHVKHLNLSSNHLRHVPVWKSIREPCVLLTLKMRQNSLEEIKGIEPLKSIEELDLSDNYITVVPEQIRQLTSLKRVFFERNPFTYDSDYRQMIIRNLPYVFAQPNRELIIDNQVLTLKEKQKIPMRQHAAMHSVQGFTTYSVPTSVHSTTSDSTTEPESITTTSSGVSGSGPRSRRRQRNRHSRKHDRDETPTGQRTSSSDAEKTSVRRRLNKVIESTEEIDGHHPVASCNTSSSGIVEPDDNTSKTTPSDASSIPRKLSNEESDSSKRRKSPRSRKSEAPTRIFVQVVDIPNNVSDDTAVPDSPVSVTELSISQNHPTPMPVLDPKLNHHDESSMAHDNMRSIFFVTDQTSENNRLLTIELDPLHLIEKDNNNEEYLENIRYSTIKMTSENDNHDNKNRKTVEFTFEKRRHEVERRMYLFDTIQDRKAFVEEIDRHLEKPTLVEIPMDFTSFLQCSKCGKTFPPLSSMNNADTASAPMCLSCRNASLNPSTELNPRLHSNTSVDISSDEIDLDHHLHFQVATEHFTHNNEKIKLHFKCYVVPSTTNRFFIARTILTNYGVYIFEYQSSNTTKDTEYVLVGKDLLTNVLMLDIGYRLQTFTIELQSAAFAFVLADRKKTQQVANHFLEVLSPIISSDEGALQKISHISSDEYRQRLFEIIKSECHIDEPNDDMIDFYSTMIRMDQLGNSQMIALLLLQNWILMIEDDYMTIDSRHVRLPAQPTSETNQQLKCDLMHLVNVTNYVNHPKEFLFDFVDESETKEIRWKLEGLSDESKDEFLNKVRDSYKKFMAVPMPELVETS